MTFSKTLLAKKQWQKVKEEAELMRGIKTTTKTNNMALWASTIKIKLKIEKKSSYLWLRGQICYMRSSSGPDLSFETLKSEFDCITKKNNFSIMGIFLPKLRDIAPLPGFLYNLQIYTETYNKQWCGYLTLFRRFFLF